MKRDRKRVVCPFCRWESRRVDKSLPRQDENALARLCGVRHGFCIRCGGKMARAR